MRRVLIDGLSARSGGGWTYLVNVARELDADSRGFSFHILVRAEKAALLDSLRNVEVIPVRCPSAVLRVIYEETLLPLRARQFDLLYALADMAPVFGRVPTVVALRNLNIYDRRWYDTPRLRWLERLARLGARRARSVVFPSRAAGEWIANHLGIPEEKIEIVHHGISPERFGPVEAAGASGSEPYLLLPAAVERHKNIVGAVRAMASVSDPGLQLWIAGGHTDPAYLAEVRAEMERLEVAHRVRLLGAVEYARIADLYRGARAMVLPSWIETFGHPLLEAMLLGTPVAVTDLPVFHEIAADAGWFFPADDPEAMARVFDAILGDPEGRDARIRAGRDRVSEFTWKRSVDDLCAVFERALAR